MSYLDSLSLPPCPPVNFLKQNPFLSDLLLADCNYDFAEVTALIEPLLTAPKRCQRTGLYIQAVTTGYTAFLATNLIECRIAEITPVSSSWLMGRSAACAIPLPHSSVSRRHAVIGHHPLNGFYIADLGSLNGTQVNHRRIASTERVLLQDGDLIQFGSLQIEFFLTRRSKISASMEETV